MLSFQVMCIAVKLNDRIALAFTHIHVVNIYLSLCIDYCKYKWPYRFESQAHCVLKHVINDNYPCFDTDNWNARVYVGVSAYAKFMNEERQPWSVESNHLETLLKTNVGHWRTAIQQKLLASISFRLDENREV